MSHVGYVMGLEDWVHLISDKTDWANVELPDGCLLERTSHSADRWHDP